MSSGFEVEGPNSVISKDGEIRIARVGLSVIFHGRQYNIDSEMLDPPMSIVIYFRNSRAAQSEEAEDIRSFIEEALTFRGFMIEFI
ncbi:hypothetical protein [Sinomonas albida]|uniref:hypothetical protein n=1 Tax=Sinomonas albida TaxID=369942 RepID=UPI003017AE34